MEHPSRPKAKKPVRESVGGMLSRVEKITDFFLLPVRRLALRTGFISKKGNADFLDLLLFLVVAAISFFVFFYRLDAFPLRMWDEARNGVNALEMLRGGGLIVTRFNGAPEMWNTKPPLFIWLAASFFRILGPGELALRLPSALSAAAVVVLMYWFGRIVLKDRWVGFIGALIILSSMGFPDTHIGRTGDYDALLTFFVFAGSASFFTFLEGKKMAFLFLAAAFFTLAVLTKSVAAFFVVPGILVYLVLSGNLVKTLRKKEFLVSALTGALVILSYYLGRNIINPGYLQAVLKEELFARYGKAFAPGGEGVWYYWRWMANFRFQVWIYFVPFTILGFFLTRNASLKRFIPYAFFLSLSCFLIISGSENKNLWYDAQLYPFFSLLVAALIVIAIERLPLLLRVFPVLILAFYTQRYIRTNYAYIQRYDAEREVYACIRYGYLFRTPPASLAGYAASDKDEAYCMPLVFYTEQYGMKRKAPADAATGDRILSCSDDTIKAIEALHKTKDTFRTADGCRGIEVL